MTRIARLALVALALSGCGAPAEAPHGGAEAANDAGTDAFVPPRPAPARPSAPSPRVSIAAGTVLAGSRPGTPGRRPAMEADLAPITVPAFEIDRRAEPIPDRLEPRRVSFADANAACAARGARLCDELEWERACEGDAHASLPTTTSFEACVAHPESCETSTGVIAQGVLAAEWTVSGGQAVLRGARADQDAPMHRCDARTTLSSTEGREAAIRCCYGAAPTLAYPRIQAPRPFTPLAIDTSALRAHLRAIPELARWADGFTPYGIDDAARAYQRAGSAIDPVTRARLADGPLLWSPANGERAWLFAGTSGADTLLVVLYPLDDDTVIHGASFVFAGEHLPVALTPVPQERASVAWTTRAGTSGENGFVRFDEDAVIRIVGQ